MYLSVYLGCVRVWGGWHPRSCLFVLVFCSRSTPIFMTRLHLAIVRIFQFVCAKHYVIAGYRFVVPIHFAPQSIVHRRRSPFRPIQSTTNTIQIYTHTPSELDTCTQFPAFRWDNCIIIHFSCSPYTKYGERCSEVNELNGNSHFCKRSSCRAQHLTDSYRLCCCTILQKKSNPYLPPAFS